MPCNEVKIKFRLLKNVTNYLANREVMGGKLIKQRVFFIQECLVA